MSATVTGFYGARPGNGPYFSPRFRPSKKSNAGKFYRRKNIVELVDFDDYFSREDSYDEDPFVDINDILAFGEFGFVKAYKARLRRRGLDPKQLYCVNRHVINEHPRTCLTSLPKIKRTFLIQQNYENDKEEIQDVTSPIDGHLKFNIKKFKAGDSHSKSNNSQKDVPKETKLESRLRQLENDYIPGFISRKKNHGRPLGNITTSSYLSELLASVSPDNKKRPSIFYRTEIE